MNALMCDRSSDFDSTCLQPWGVRSFILNSSDIEHSVNWVVISDNNSSLSGSDRCEDEEPSVESFDPASPVSTSAEVLGNSLDDETRAFFSGNSFFRLVTLRGTRDIILADGFARGPSSMPLLRSNLTAQVNREGSTSFQDS